MTHEKKHSKKIVMFRPTFVTDSIRSMFSSWDNNTGNQIFTESIIKNINPQVLSWESYKKAPFPVDAVVSTDLIWIHERANFDYIVKMAEVLKVPIIPLGVGIQTHFGNKEFHINASAQYVLELLQERATLGVRGENTAYILEKHGIKNINIIGCPSVYYYGENGYNVKQNDFQRDKVVCNFKSLGGNLSNNEKNFLSYCRTRNYSFVEQTAHTFNLGACNYDRAYYAYVSPWYDENKEIFFNVDAWKAHMKKFEFCIGARFHGNVIALWENIPSLFLTVDARTQEMVDFFKFPYIQLKDFDWEKPIEYYYELANYSEFHKIYNERYRNYITFLNSNGIEIR